MKSRLAFQHPFNSFEIIKMTFHFSCLNFSVLVLLLAGMVGEGNDIVTLCKEKIYGNPIRLNFNNTNKKLCFVYSQWIITFSLQSIDTCFIENRTL